DVVDFSELFVARYKSENKMIKYIYMRSVKSDKHLDVSVVPEIPLAPEGFGILSDVIRNAKSIILNDYQDTLKKSKTTVTVRVTGNEEENPEETKAKPQSAIILPITLEDEVLGVIQLYTETRNAYNEEHLVFLEAFMQQVSLAYKNAILYKKVQDELNEKIEAEKYLTEALNEREILLKEIYHRVKNNLQLVASLLRMQSQKIKDPEIRKYFLESKDKVIAISLIHEKLYKMRDLSRIDFADYIFTLANSLKGMHSLDNSIDINVSAQKLFLPIDIAMPCGLILNELITNALKHAFDDHSKNPKIEILFSLNPELKKYTLIIKDNGKGFPQDVDYNNSNTLGVKLINTLINQVDGTLQLIKENGSTIIIDFPPSSYQNRI
ncbi:MAG: histidine kinase dimerization/phosphoacceptor domain -containing protein, partial [Ignavibacteria bacterium]